jgi:hypothetical protein
MGAKCPFPHRPNVKAQAPKGSTTDATGKMHLPSWKTPKKGKALTAISMHLADPDDGRDDNEE